MAPTDLINAGLLQTSLYKKKKNALSMKCKKKLQQTGSKSGKEYVKAVYCHPAYLTYMQSTSWAMPGWMNTS